MDSFDPEFGHISGGRGVYYEPYLHYYAPSTHGQTPYNMQDAAGLTYIALWKSTGDSRFRDRAEALAKTLKAEFTPVGDRYQWRYAAYNAVNSASDISHAGLDVNFAVAAYEAGLVFSDTDIQRLANTMSYIQKGDGFTPRVDGAGEGVASQTRLASLWLPLTRYDAALREQMFPVFQDSWNASVGLWPTLGSALMYETGRYYTQESVFEESFDDLQLSPRWRRPETQPIGDTWTTQTINSQLLVSDIQSTSSGEHWVDILRSRSVMQDDTWEVAYDISWDSDAGTADPLQAMQRFFVQLRDSSGDLIARVGINDGWSQSSGARVIQLFNEIATEPAGSLDLSGTASIRIISDVALGSSEIYWDDNLVLSVPQVVELNQVEMLFGHFQSSSASHFGQIGVESLIVREPSVLLTGDFNEDSIVDGSDLLAWQRGFGAISGAALADGDGNGDGAVNDADLHIWEGQFGSGLAATAGLAVPEPSALVGQLIACILFYLSMRTYTVR